MKLNIKITVLLLMVAAIAFLGAGCTKQAKKERHLSKANQYFQAGELAKAEIEYLSAMRLGGPDPLAITRLGQIYYERGDLPRAFAFLNKSLEYDTNNVDVHVKVGTIMLTGRKVKEAREHAEFALSKAPTNDEALILLSDSIASPQEIDTTWQKLQKLNATAGNRPGYHVAMGNLLLRRQDATNAETAFKRAIAIDPKFSQAHLALGLIYWLRDDLKQADAEFKTAADLSPLKSPRRLKYAEFKIRTGDLDAAKKILESVTDQAQDYVPAWTYRAEIAFAEKKWDECKDLIQKILTRDSGNYEALLMRARLRLVQGETAKAIEEFTKMANDFARIPQVHFELAKAHLRNQDPVKAISSLNQALAADPNYVDAILALAEINLRKGDTAAAISPLITLTKKRPELTRAQLLLAAAYRQRNAPDDALAIYRALAAKQPKNPEIQMLIGSVLRSQTKNAEARKAFEKAFELAPGYLPALDQLVTLDVNDKRFDDAVRRIQAVAEKAPKNPVLPYMIGRVYMVQKDYPKAEAALLKSNELDPEYRASFIALSQVYVAQNKHKEAIAKLEAIAARGSNDVSALMQIGMIHEAAKDLEKARDTYERVIKIEPKFSPALNNLAYLYSEKFNNLDRAYELGKTANELMPNDPFTSDTFGWILYKRGDYGRALTLIAESAEKLEDQAEVQYHLGMANYMLGNEAAARTALQTALKTGDDFPGKSDAQIRLSFLATGQVAAGPQAIAELEKHLQAHPSDPIVLMRLATAYEAAGNFDKARTTYEQMLKANPKAVTATVRLAQIYATHLNNPAKAMEYAKSARALAPDDPDIAHTLGNLAFATGDFKWAQSLLSESARKDSSDPEVLFDLALADYQVGRVADAQSGAQTALRLNPSFSRAAAAQAFLAMLDLSLNPARAIQSVAQIQAALKANSNDTAALMAACLVHEQQGKWAEARQIYETILARNPLFFPAARGLAIIYSQNPADTQKGYELAVKARENYPTDADVARALGIINYRRNDFNNATRLLTESVRKRTNDAEAFYYLGLAQSQLKQKKEATASLQKALALNATAPFATDAKRALTDLAKP